MVTSAEVESLIEQVRSFLMTEKEPVSEHDLVAELSHNSAFQGFNRGSAITKQFQMHFLIMHVLYRLRERLMDTQYRLHMRPDAIYLCDLDAPERVSANMDEEEQNDAVGVEEEDEAVRDYYLDLTQLTVGNGSLARSPDDYKRHYNRSQRQESLAALELKSGADWRAVKSAYRLKAIEYHPEKGGDVKQFQRVREAYNELKRSLHS